MSEHVPAIYLVIVLAPLAGAVLAGLFGGVIGRSGAHRVTILGVAISCILSAIVFKRILMDGGPHFDGTVYTWAIAGGIHFQIGFLVDQLTATMIMVVTFVSLAVHIYTIGYMADEEGYQRFFSYIALFTFGMLMLVMANNFLQLFFGWEMVGLMSYLLIGFYYTRESAIFAGLKAFLVNRVGDFGFVLGIAAVLLYTGSLHYADVFAAAPKLQSFSIPIFPGVDWSVPTAICVLLFVGAMGKSAQVPLHSWLPDSMEGPTPISALIHAATMVTAGIFMVARMSPLYELSEPARTLVMVTGATGAFFLGLVGVVQSDIKRVIAYSTMSQLGYMAAALGASAYAAGIFHLATHAFFKALLFLCSGSVIIAMHHDQDMRNMGGLRKYMPITWITTLIGALALSGFPGFSGFFSKDAIIEAVHAAQLPGAGFAYACVVGGAFVTALYIFRLYFLVFHGEPRMDEHTREHLKESPAVVTVPLIMLAVPSVVIGWPYWKSVLSGAFFGKAITVSEAHAALPEILHEYHGPIAFTVHGFLGLPFWFAVGGFVVAWYFYHLRPDLPPVVSARLGLLYRILVDKYGFDRLYQSVFAAGGRGLGSALWQAGDVRVIDGLMVNGSAWVVRQFSGIVRQIQSGYLYHYAFAMVLGLVVLLTWFVHG